MRHFNKIAIYSGLLLLSASLFISCQDNKAAGKQDSGNSQHSEKTNGDNSHREHTHQGNNLHELKESLEHGEVLITKKQMNAVDIKLGKVTRQQLSRSVKAFGEIVLPPSGKATVSAVIGGRIHNIEVIEGDYVNKGDVIARIEHPNIVDMQRDYLETLNRDDYLKLEYERQKRLLADSVNAAKTFQNARAEYQSNLARLQSLKQKLQLIHINPEKLSPSSIHNAYPLVAPMSGYVADVNTNTGMYVTPQKSLFQIKANDKAHIDLEVYEKNLTNISSGQKLTFNLAGNPRSQPLEGRIMKTSKSFNSDKRTALVHARITKKNDNILPGMSVIAHIQTGGKEQEALPESAFVTDQGRDYLFMMSKKGTVENTHQTKRDTKKQESGHAEHHHEKEQGESTHYYLFQRIEVEKEISRAGFNGFHFKGEAYPNALFVVNNAQALLSEMKKGGGAHGHAH
jgi:cobalt-zinc-cadmium efflux system membrane fusion protein